MGSRERAGECQHHQKSNHQRVLSQMCAAESHIRETFTPVAPRHPERTVSAAPVRTYLSGEQTDKRKLCPLSKPDRKQSTFRVLEGRAQGVNGRNGQTAPRLQGIAN